MAEAVEAADEKAVTNGGFDLPPDDAEGQQADEDRVMLALCETHNETNEAVNPGTLCERVSDDFDLPPDRAADMIAELLQNGRAFYPADAAEGEIAPNTQ
jgi:hypothetical protein